jgi:benzoyl-CoA reductase/2-hydroxyglutaryl-CoA dehydratase subunit BcrC/BadD/HgdB
VADIQLSSQLFQDIQAAVQRQAPDADQGVVMQYLAAVMGYMLGSQRGMAAADRDDFMNELCGFARHVYEDVANQQQQQQQATPPSGEAFGYWEPPQS